MSCSSLGGGAEPALAAAAGYLGGERVQVRGPERAELVEPGVDVAQRLRVYGVKPTGTLGAHSREPRLAQDAEVLGHRGLGDPELGSDGLGDRARRLLTAREQLENASADGIAEDVERVHKSEHIMVCLYKSRLLMIGQSCVLAAAPSRAGHTSRGIRRRRSAAFTVHRDDPRGGWCVDHEAHEDGADCGADGGDGGRRAGAGAVVRSPPPIQSYAGDPGRLGDPASWRTPEFLRDNGMIVDRRGVRLRRRLLRHRDEHRHRRLGLLRRAHARARQPRDELRDRRSLLLGGSPGRRDGPDAAGSTTRRSTTATARTSAGPSARAATASARRSPPAPSPTCTASRSTPTSTSATRTRRTACSTGILPATATAAQTPDNAYLGNVYRAVNAAATANGKPIRLITSSWGSQPQHRELQHATSRRPAARRASG